MRIVVGLASSASRVAAKPRGAGHQPPWSQHSGGALCACAVSMMDGDLFDKLARGGARPERRGEDWRGERRETLSLVSTFLHAYLEIGRLSLTIRFLCMRQVQMIIRAIHL